MDTKFNIGDWVYAVFFDQCILYAQIKSIKLESHKMCINEKEIPFGIKTTYNFEFDNNFVHEKYNLKATTLENQQGVINVFSTYEEALDYFKSISDSEEEILTKGNTKRK